MVGSWKGWGKGYLSRVDDSSLQQVLVHASLGVVPDVDIVGVKHLQDRGSGYKPTYTGPKRCNHFPCICITGT